MPIDWMPGYEKKLAEKKKTSMPWSSSLSPTRLRVSAKRLTG
jgi:hypothetical protein